MPKMAAIVDKDGDVWTGAIVRKGCDAATGIGATALLGPIGLFLALSDDTVTVKINGEEHTGTRVKNSD
jgi:hypothetical protein